MSKADERLRERTTKIRAVLTQTGPTSDISAEIIAAHMAKSDTFLAKEAAELAAKSGLAVAVDLTKTLWKAFWLLCCTVEDVALANAPTAAAEAAIRKGDTSGGFSITRARSRATALQGALVHFPEGFTAIGVSRAQILARVGECLNADTVAAEQRSLLKGARAEKRLAARDLHRENNRIMKILRATHPPGSPMRETLDIVPPAHPPRSRRKKKPTANVEGGKLNG